MIKKKIESIDNKERVPMRCGTLSQPIRPGTRNINRMEEIMKKTITTKWLESKEACHDGIKWFKSQKEKDPIKIIKELVRIKRYDWAIWLIVNFMPRVQK